MIKNEITFSEYCSHIQGYPLSHLEKDLCNYIQKAYEQNTTLFVNFPRFCGRSWVKRQFESWKYDKI